jgi:hypothetical protein
VKAQVVHLKNSKLKCALTKLSLIKIPILSIAKNNKYKANSLFASLFWVFTVTKKNASNSDTKTDIQPIPLKKLSISINFSDY